jgi:hypothetical protein
MRSADGSDGVSSGRGAATTAPTDEIESRAATSEAAIRFMGVAMTTWHAK